jgi:hypothetical protein
MDGSYGAFCPVEHHCYIYYHTTTYAIAAAFYDSIAIKITSLSLSTSEFTLYHQRFLANLFCQILSALGRSRSVTARLSSRSKGLELVKSDWDGDYVLKG